MTLGNTPLDPLDPDKTVSATAARNLPPTCAGGEDDVSSNKLPQIIISDYLPALLFYIYPTQLINLVQLLVLFNAGRSEGCARTGYFIPVRDGMEAGEVWNFFRRRRRHRPPQKVLKKLLFSKHQILRFVTHSRALNVLAAAYCREFR